MWENSPVFFSPVLQFNALCILITTYEVKSQNPDFHSRTVHPDIIKFFIIQLNAPLDYSRLKLTLKFTLKCSYMLRLTNHHQGAYCRALLKL